MTPQLACAVLSYRDEPHLVEAVRSVLEQDMPIEVVVVNSGGGAPTKRLAEHGIQVPVYDLPGRRFAGAVRNVGIAATRAPIMSFLAADCLAMPGWAAARLTAHGTGAAAVASVLTNAYPDHAPAWASLLLLHHRRLTATAPTQRLLYSLSYQRDLFERYGQFREDLRAGEDTEFNARFAGAVEVRLAPGAVTAHRYPVTMPSFLAEAFRRGRRDARAMGALEGRGPRRLFIASLGPGSVGRSLRVATRTPTPDRGRMLRAWPLVIPGAVAYMAGGLTATQRPSAVP